MSIRQLSLDVVKLLVTDNSTCDEAQLAYSLLRNYLSKFCRRYTAPHDDVDNIVSEAIYATLLAYKSNKLRDVDYFVGYAIGAAKFICYSALRVAQSALIEDLDALIVLDDKHEFYRDIPTDEHTELEARINYEQRLRHVLDCLHALRPQDQELLIRVLVYKETPLQTQNNMMLTDTQYRLHKNRALAKLIAKARVRITS